MRVYDLVLVIKSSLSEDKRKKTVEKVKEWLQDVRVVKHDQWGQKVLAYPIKHELSGHYHMLSLEAKEVIGADFEKHILALEDIIRHLLIRKK